MILRERWDARTDDSGRPLTRARQGRGGGREFHFSLLPIPAQAELVLRARNDIGRKRTTEAERLLVMFDLLAQQVDMARVQLREILAGDGL